MSSFICRTYVLMQKKKGRGGPAGKSRGGLENVIGSEHGQRLLYTRLSRSQ